MPPHLVFHIRNAFSFYRLGDDRRRPAFYRLGFVHCLCDLVEIIAVDIDHMEIEGFKFFVNGIRGIDFLDSAVDLQIIVVHDHQQIIKLSVCCQHCGLPHLSFLDLTVSQKGIYAVVLSGKFRRDRHSHCCGNALSQGTG